MANCYSFILLISLLLCQSLVLSHSQTYPINVWPKPREVSWPSPKATTLSPHFIIVSPYHPHLGSAVDRYSALISSQRYHPIVPPSVNITSAQPLDCLTLLVSDLSCTLQHQVDESYTLSIANGTANLTARTVWGAMHGLETFRQLTWDSPPVVATDIFIHDEPIFPHRGVLLDTSRNYYPVRDILRTIDVMASNKLNVFHWHITDSHSFPIELPSEPELAEKGSYGPGMRYSVKDVTEIVEYGLSRGVRVMPEIDAPGLGFYSLL